MVIRHAEKPTGDIKGITTDGTKDNNSLIVQGWQRAGALVVLFDPFDGHLQNEKLVVPDVLYASPAGSESKSKRPVETITPLSQRLDLSINTNFGKDDFKAMADNAMQQQGTVLICWQHSEIPHIANHILSKNVSPQTWPKDCFDMIWVFDLDQNTGEYSFSQVPQNLLAGDRNSKIPT